MGTTSAARTAYPADRHLRDTEGLDVRQLERVPYAEAYALQIRLRDARLAGEVPDTVLLLEHPDVITCGRGTRPENLLRTEDELRQAGYEVHQVNRGGDVTYHGPGQLVGYPILDLARRERDVHRYLRALERVLLDTLSEFGVPAMQRDGYAGVWLDPRHKIASIGVGLRRWVTLHGFALNVCCDLRRFEVIVACGLDDVEMVSMSSVLGAPVDPEPVRIRLEHHLRKVFG